MVVTHLDITRRGIFTVGINSKTFPWPVNSIQKTLQIFCDVWRGLHFCQCPSNANANVQCPSLQNRTVNTALLLVANTRRHAVVGCHAVLFFVARRYALFQPNILLWARITAKQNIFLRIHTNFSTCSSSLYCSDSLQYRLEEHVQWLSRCITSSSHHMVKTDAGLNGLYIREITIYIRLYYYINS